MQYTKVILSVAALASSVFAAPAAADVKVADVDVSVGPCLTDAHAKYFVDSFIDFLEYTNYNGTQAPKGRGFNTALANKVLAENFTDISDSINFLAQQPLGTPTFPSRAAFIAGQGAQPEVNVTLLNTWHTCNTITFRYRLFTGAGANLPVTGINVMELNPTLCQVQTQYAEFDNAAWLVDLGNPECAAKQG